MKRTVLKMVCMLAWMGSILILGSAWGGEISEAPSEALKLAQQLNQAFIEVADKVSPAVVVVKVARKADSNRGNGNPLRDMLPPEFRRFFEEPTPENQEKPEGENPNFRDDFRFEGQGSGVVIRESGIILTNRHVVEGADEIVIRFKDGEEYPAKTLGVDRHSDIAVVKIEATGLAAAEIGDSDQTRVGEFAIAIGAPFELDYSVTFGHVSAKGRMVLNDRVMFDQDFIQTDASINPGNSGGPLVDIYGKVIAINTMIRGLNTGIGFAVPINLAMRVAEQLIEEGKVTRAWLGIQISTLRDDVDYRDLAVGVEDGVVVRGKVPDGPAADSDLKPADVITQVDDRMVRASEDLKRELRRKKAGETVILKVMRNGKPLEVTVKTGAFPDELNRQLFTQNPDSEEPEKASLLGMTVQNLTQELAGKFKIEEQQGVIVTRLENGSVAQRKGIAPGDVITRIDNQPVESVDNFTQIIGQANLEKGIIVHLKSSGSERFEVLKQKR